jgi:hypothetical protein
MAAEDSKAAWQKSAAAAAAVAASSAAGAQLYDNTTIALTVQLHESRPYLSTRFHQSDGGPTDAPY